MEKASFRPENMAGDQTRATEVLSDGRKFADELLIMLRSQPLRDANNISCSLSAGDLVSKILNSFEKSLLILQPPSSFVSDEDSQVPVNTVYSAGAPKSEELDSGQTDKIISVRRGCYKRRRTSDIETKVSQSLVEDGHAWRKYGQKSIQNAKHPRNYYRCTHKFEQGCLATKQVQKTEDSSSMYRTTYYGSHTCKNNYTDHNQFFLDSIDRKDSSSTSVLLSFQTSKKSPPNYRTAINTTTNPSSISSFADRLHPTFGSSSTATELLSPAGSDYADAISSGVYSCTTSTCTPDNTTSFDDELDMMVAGVNFDDDDMAGDGFFLEL